MRVIIIGAKGMLGRELVQTFADFEPIAWDFEDIDITKRDIVFEKITNEQPAVVINAAAYTDVNRSESEEALAAKVNGEAVGFLAEACQQINAVLVHYGTDYVFDGAKKAGYIEDDIPNPINAYGRTKLLGEQLLQKHCQKYYLIRTSWLFGRFGPKNFVQKIINRAKELDSLPLLKKIIYQLTGKFRLKVVDDSFGKPTNAYDLAQATREILENKITFGIYHVTNETAEGGISWYEFAKKAVELSGLKIKVVPCKSTDFPQPAKRPQFSALVNAKISKRRGWEEALREYLNLKY